MGYAKKKYMGRKFIHHAETIYFSHIFPFTQKYSSCKNIWAIQKEKKNKFMPKSMGRKKREKKRKER